MLQTEIFSQIYPELIENLLASSHSEATAPQLFW